MTTAERFLICRWRRRE